jgi:hypothetical protein
MSMGIKSWFKTIKFFIQTVQGTAHVILVGALYGSLTQTTLMGEVTPISHTINGSTTPTGVNDTFCTICSGIPDRPTTQIEKVVPLLVYISAGLLMARDSILYFLNHEWLLFDSPLILLLCTTCATLLYSLGNFWLSTYQCLDFLSNATCLMRVKHPSSASLSAIKNMPEEEKSLIFTVLSIVILLASSVGQLGEGLIRGKTHYIFLTELVAVNESSVAGTATHKQAEAKKEGDYVQMQGS